MSTEHWAAAALSLENSIVVMGGCAYSSLSSAEQYDTTLGQWSAFPSMNTACYGCAAVLDGKIIVVRGNDEKYYALSSQEEYGPNTGKWPTYLTCTPNVMAVQLQC
eukprot:13339554-Ditylum_brightwellii.AAC.2